MNSGGPASLIRLDHVPELEQETAIPATALNALDAWQARAGEILTVVDPLQTCYRARLISINSDEAACVPFERLERPVESTLQLQVFHAFPEKERFELVLEKLTELGVTRIVPMLTARSSTLEERDAAQKKSHRWPHLLRRAGRQCRRAMLPELLTPVGFDEALEMASQAELKLLLDEGQPPWTLSEGLAQLRPESIALLVGPEGGFTREEVTSAQGAGVLPVRLGPRILRTETAAIVAAAMLQGLVGDLG